MQPEQLMGREPVGDGGEAGVGLVDQEPERRAVAADFGVLHAGGKHPVVRVEAAVQDLAAEQDDAGHAEDHGHHGKLHPRQGRRLEQLEPKPFPGSRVGTLPFGPRRGGGGMYREPLHC